MEKHMKLWGVLSIADEEAGFEVVLDENWQVLVKEKETILAKLDPSVYTLPELRATVEALVTMLQGNLYQERNLDSMSKMTFSEISFLAMLKFNHN